MKQAFLILGAAFLGFALGMWYDVVHPDEVARCYPFFGAFAAGSAVFFLKRWFLETKETEDADDRAA